jgi:putative flippase GtrA
VRALLLFALAGGAGYLVDAAVLLLAAPWVGPYVGRLLSFCAAVVTTWLVNRSLTFRGRRSDLPLHREFLRYFVVCLGGGVVNFAVYSLLVFMFALSDWHLLLALGVGSLAGMGVNFAFSKRFVFKHGNAPGEEAES